MNKPIFIESSPPIVYIYQCSEPGGLDMYLPNKLCDWYTVSGAQ